MVYEKRRLFDSLSSMQPTIEVIKWQILHSKKNRFFTKPLKKRPIAPKGLKNDSSVL
jgi:hypothetical protein